jgi:hypothetical protein
VTLAPAETSLVRGVDGPDYKVGHICANPKCGKFAEHAHHIWRRSALGGPYSWVAIVEDGHEVIAANLCGLCPDCHDDITGKIGGHRARIIWRNRQFFWAEVGGSVTGLLNPHPPTPESLSRAGHSPESESCPFCGQEKRRRSPRSVPGGRRRKSWVVKVPDDAEDGAEILDALVEDVGLTLGKDPANSGRYYILLPALVHAAQNKAALVESLKGVGG